MTKKKEGPFRDSHLHPEEAWRMGTDNDASGTHRDRHWDSGASLSVGFLFPDNPALVIVANSQREGHPHACPVEPFFLH